MASTPLGMGESADEGSHNPDAAVAILRDAWVALTMIRDAVEELAPVGAMRAREQLGPELLEEAEEIVKGIMAIARG